MLYSNKYFRIFSKFSGLFSQWKLWVSLQGEALAFKEKLKNLENNIGVEKFIAECVS